MNNLIFLPIQKLLTIILFLMISSFYSYSQQTNDESFDVLLVKAHAYYAQPLETFFKPFHYKSTSEVHFDHGLKSRQASVDILYKIIPIPIDSRLNFAPQVKMSSIAINLASNEEDEADMVFHQIDEEDLNPFNAEFGISVFFQPKDKWTDRKHCKATFMYAEGKGIICTFLLFDRTDINLRPFEQNLTFSKGSL